MILSELFFAQLKDYTELLACENRIASLSNHSVAHELMNTIKKLSYCYLDPCMDTIKELSNKACHMLAKGDSPQEVLWYFDLLLEKQLNPKR